MIRVVLEYKNGQTQAVTLAGAPRKGDIIQIANGKPSPRLLVTDVMWTSGDETPPGPEVFVFVRPRDEQ